MGVRQLTAELPKLVDALYEKDVEIEFQAVGSEKYPPKVLLETTGEITGKKQLNLF